MKRSVKTKMTTTLDLLISAIIKLDRPSGERQNVTAFLESCYGGRVRKYDYVAAMASLEKLSGEEYHALVDYVLQHPN